jgi:O-antigen/teichoic acid export membrane protein
MKTIGVPRNVLFGMMSWFVPLTITFLVTPIVVRGLGHEEYGLYALVQGFIVYSFNFNVGRALTKYIATFRVNHETEKIGQAISATLLVNLLVGAVGAGLFALGSGWLVSRALNIPTPLQHEARLAFYLAAATVVPVMLGFVFNAVPQALQRFDIYSLVTLGGAAVNMIGSGILVLLGHGVLALLAWNLLGMTLVCVIFIIYARVLLPEARLTFHIPGELFRGVTGFSASVVAYQLLANILLLFERGWIARTLGTEAVTYYVVPMTVAICIHAFFSSVTLVIFPLASEAHAQENTVLLKLIYTRALKYICVSVVFICVTLCVCGHQLLASWLSPDFADHSARVLGIQAVVFSLLAVSIVPWQLADGLGRPSFNAMQVGAWLIIAIPLMIWLTPIWGVNGSAIARLASVVTVPIHLLLIERWALKENLWSFWARTAGMLLLAGAAAGTVEYFVVRNVWKSWGALAVAVGAGALAYVGCLLLTRFVSNDEQTWLRGFVMRAVTS